jgi:hypothetical protein
MDDTNLYETRLPELMAIPEKKVQAPSIPVDILVQEGVQLAAYAVENWEQLSVRKISRELLDDIPSRCELCRIAEAKWLTVKNKKENLEKQWAVEVPLIKKLLADILHNMRYAFRNHPEVLDTLHNTIDSKRLGAVIQNLKFVYELGTQNRALYEESGFDMAEIEKAGQKATELSALLADKRVQAKGGKQLLTVRNRAATFLKTAVNDIRAAGQNVFWHDEVNLSRYTSEYIRNLNRSGNLTPPATVPPKTPPVKSV